jgi:hypothetical protein
MGRKKQASFKMKGHTLPGINQKSETANIKDGRSPSSAFQMKEPGDSPNKFLGALAGVAGGALLGKTKFGKNLMSKGKNLLGNVGSKIGFGGAAKAGGGGNEDAEAGKELLKEEAKEEMGGDTAMAMKLKTGKKKQ